MKILSLESLKRKWLGEDYTPVVELDRPSRLRVFVDRAATANGSEVVVKYTGSSSFDAGFFYCPYVPLQMTDD